MQISKSIILPEWESIEDLNQASDILKQITEALKDHNLQNYDDAVANYRRITTGRIQSVDGLTYFDLDTGVIKGEMIFRAGSSGLGNVEEASPDDWDNAFKLANAVKGDSDFTLISGGKIITESIAVGAFNSDVIARMFSSGTAQENIEAWMKAGHITWIDGAKIYAGSITLTGLGETIISGGYLQTVKINANLIQAGTIQGIRFMCGGGTDEDIYFEDSGIRMYDVGTGVVRISKTYGNHLDIGVGISNVLHLLFLGDLSISNDENFIFRNTGALQLPALTDDPTENLMAGQLAIVNNVLRIYDGANWSNV